MTDITTPILLDDAALDELMRFPDVPLPEDTARSVGSVATSILQAMGSADFSLSPDHTKAMTKNSDLTKRDNVNPNANINSTEEKKETEGEKKDPNNSLPDNGAAAVQSYQSFAEQNQRLQHENHRYSILASQLTAEVAQLRFKVQSQDMVITQLQDKMAVQQGEFDQKFDQFLACANQYDVAKKNEIESLKRNLMMMESKYKALNEEYGRMSEKWMSQGGSNGCDVMQWKNWKWLDIFQWISSLNEPRLSKYHQALYDNLQRDKVSGQWLENIQDDDLGWLGIENYSDRQLLMHHIKMLLHGLTHEPPPTLKSMNSHNSHGSLQEIASKGRSQSPASNLTHHGGSGPNDGYNDSPSYSFMSSADNTGSDQLYYRQFTVEQLQDIRIRQKNIVYVVGLPVSLCNAKLLKSHKWFGKFGTISRICFNTSPKCVKANSIPTFVTYTKDADALQAIRKMNLYCLADGTRLKTNFGRTKFCPAFTHGEKCLNEKCKFLHRWAKVEDIITEQEISDFNAIRAGPPSRYSRR